MFVDASAIIAILTEEAEGEALAAALDTDQTARPITSVIAIWEAAVGLFRKKGFRIDEAEARVREFLECAGVQILPVSEQELTLALKAYEQFGRHRIPDAERNRALNLADCFHYACAKRNRTSILHKDAGFDLTDVPNSLP
jgi:ribonuclease VapC